MKLGIVGTLLVFGILHGEQVLSLGTNEATNTTTPGSTTNGIWTTTTFAPDPKQYEDAIFVALDSNLDGAADPVKFDQVIVDVSGSYDKKTGKFLALSDGDYWAATSVGVKSATIVQADLMRDHTPMGLTYKYNYINGEDTVSRDILVSMDTSQSIHMRSRVASGQFSDEGLQSSLTLFRLSSLMSPAVWFSAVRTSDHKGADRDVIPFDNLLVNQGGAFEVSLYFTAPQDGLYFFSFSIGAWKALKTVTHLRRNGIILSTLSKFSTTNTNYELMSRAGMFYLKKDDWVNVSIDKTSQVHSSPNEYMTSFSGFLYNPIHGQQIVWSVAKNDSWFDSKFFIYPIPFEEVLVNQGGGWKRDKHIFVVPITGIYYITLTVGAQAAKKVDVSVMVDWQRKMRLTRYSIRHNNIDMLSRSAIVRLEAGSWVCLSAEANTAIYSTAERHTTFTGFLLFPY